jgi:hypothetical protein
MLDYPSDSPQGDLVCPHSVIRTILVNNLFVVATGQRDWRLKYRSHDALQAEPAGVLENGVTRPGQVLAQTDSGLCFAQ